MATHPHGVGRGRLRAGALALPPVRPGREAKLEGAPDGPVRTGRGRQVERQYMRALADPGEAVPGRASDAGRALGPRSCVRAFSYVYAINKALQNVAKYK